MTLMTAESAALTDARIAAAAETAARRIAPLWPLDSFVAVNPFLGLADRSFEEAMALVSQTSGGRMTLPRAAYAEAIDGGRILDEDLDHALAQMPDVAADAAGLAKLAFAPESVAAPCKTVADLAGAASGRDWAAWVTDRISGFAAAHFDQGQAAWKARDAGGFWANWRAEASLDRSAGIMGLGGARALIATMPADGADALAWAARQTGLSGPALDRYFTRLLHSVSGWAGHARYRLWQAELAGGTDTALRDLLAVRLAWEVLLQPLAPRAAWAQAAAGYDAAPRARAEDRAALALQIAYEHGWQRLAFAALADANPAATDDRPQLQAAFCIDVRSEVFRRALETVLPGAETIGFAGFFGAAVSFAPIGAARSTARCPVLLSPGAEATETAENAEALAVRRVRRIAGGSVWARFKKAAVAGFGYVETMGLSYAPKLLGQSLRLTTALAHRGAGLSAAETARLSPTLDAIAPDDRAHTAATILNAMSLTGPFARIVLLAGHGGQSLNNPHAAGLDCGACGGHTGEANARLVAMLLNDPQVRADLPGHGIEIPADTVFIAALHDTTTDQVALFDSAPWADTHSEDLTALRRALDDAGQLARAERAELLHLDAGLPLDRAIAARARDWSQVRPEWALAGCAAFVAAPRMRTRGVDLDGRAFLHSYDWRADDGFGVLELILTAPLVVASWINLQYYGSSVDNRVFGAGNKVLHNVSGMIGVLEGTGGDLRPGLPLQSVHDGVRLIHEPMRLNAVVEAPVAAMNAVIARHEHLRALLDNGWVHLFQMDSEGRVALRYAGGGDWVPVGAETAPALAVA